jgi:hypothetical protein
MDADAGCNPAAVHAVPAQDLPRISAAVIMCARGLCRAAAHLHVSARGTIVGL